MTFLKKEVLKRIKLIIRDTVLFAKRLDHKSSLGFKNPSHRHHFLKSGDLWLHERRQTDGAEGLWRVHNKLYDFRSFIRKHPGGPFWIEATRGIDITEAFESHHLSGKPDQLLHGYYVREAKVARSSPFTFEDRGFYRTLKRRLRLTKIPRKHWFSNLATDLLLSAMLSSALLASAFWSYGLSLISGIFFGLTLVASHNYTHQRDNFRMYYSDICLMQSREWRILHVLSHHLYTNTVLDAQVYFSEPFVLFYPQNKPLLIRYGSWIYTPLILWPNLLHIGLILRLSQLLFYGKTEQLSFSDTLPLFLPLLMCAVGEESILNTLGLWLLIESIGSFTFSFLGYTTGHFHPEIFLDGDTPRPVSDSRDWGIFQLDCVADRREILGNKFLVLISFGEHALHHLLPTLDHSVLRELTPTVEDTMKEFGISIRMIPHSNMIVGYFRQLERVKPNANRLKPLKK